MNRIHKIIWSAIKEKWIVVSEKAGASGCPMLTVGALSLAVLMSTGAYAREIDPGQLPTGGTISAGDGAILPPVGNQLTVKQVSQRLVADWNSFDIGRNAAVHFDQPGSSASALNLIHDRNPSLILGTLTSTGQVFLLNGSGMIFGKTAQVNVGGLVASSLDMDRQAFMNGRNILKNMGDAGAVLNEGAITAMPGGVVALIAPQVTNTGTITATGGSVLMASGNKVTVDFGGDGLISYLIDEGAVNAQVSNSGPVKADGGVVVMTAEAADELSKAVVNNTGIVEARTLGNRSGKIVLLSDMKRGETNVSGRLDASAPDGGDGGFIETSGARVTVAENTGVTASSAYGKRGLWLIDPADITIYVDRFTGTNGLSAHTIMNTLNGDSGNGSDGADVTIATSVTGTEAGNINVNAPITWYANKLTLRAHGDININALMTANNSASLDLEPGSGTVKMGIAYEYSDPRVLPFFVGRIDFFSDGGVTPRSGNGFLFINNIDYTVITDAGNLGAQSLQNLASDLNGHFALGSNIDADVTSTWGGGAGFNPVGSSSAPFTGVFDGLGHSIYALKINRPSQDGVGLFGAIGSSTIRNVGLRAFRVSGQDFTGSLAGRVVDGSVATIANVYNSLDPDYIANSGNGYFPSVSGRSKTGGLVGALGGGTNVTISDCINLADITATAQYTGGLIGYAGGDQNVPNTLSISNSYTYSFNSGIFGAFGKIGGLLGAQEYGVLTIVNSHNSSGIFCETDALDLGGLVGLVTGGSISISKSFNEGGVNGSSGFYWKSHHVGGLVGRADTITIEESYNDVAIRGGLEVGGLVGSGGDVTITNSYNSGTLYVGEETSAGSGTFSGDYGGGLVGAVYRTGGQAGRLRITNSFSSDSVNGQSHIGGLVGGDYDLGSDISITASFWSSSANPTLSSDVWAKTFTELKSRSLFADAGWDIDVEGWTGKVWRTYLQDSTIVEHQDIFPLLRCFLIPLSIKADDQRKTYGDDLVVPSDAYTVSLGPAGYPVPGYLLSSEGYLMPNDGLSDISVSCADGLDPADPAGTYPIRLQGPATGTFHIVHYDIKESDGVLTVDKAPLGITLEGTYSGTNSIEPTSFTNPIGLKNGETIDSLISATVNDKNVSGNGSNFVTGLTIGSGSASMNNYELTPAYRLTQDEKQNTAIINRAPLTMRANDIEKDFGKEIVFDGTEFSFDPNESPKSNERVDRVTLTSNGADANAPVSSNDPDRQSPYVIEISNATGSSGFDGNNYDLQYEKGSLTVNRSLLTFTLKDLVKTYGENTVTDGTTSARITREIYNDGTTDWVYHVFDGMSYTSSVTGLAPGDTIDSVTLYSDGGDPHAGVAGSPYVVELWDFSGNLDWVNNYIIALDAAKLTIAPAPLTITASDRVKSSGEAVVFTGNEFTNTALKNNERIDLVTLTSAGADASASVTGSPYAITPSAPSGDGSFNAGNYLISFVDGKLTIDPGETVPVPQPKPDVGSIITSTQNPEIMKTPVAASDVIKVTPDPLTLISLVTPVSGMVMPDGMTVDVSGGQKGVLTVMVPEDESRLGSKFWFPLPMEMLTAAATREVSVSMADGGRLPSWLKFDPSGMFITASDLPAQALPQTLQVSVGDRSWTLAIRSESSSPIAITGAQP
jgi:filamentous hemagglutinin family protein